MFGVAYFNNIIYVFAHEDTRVPSPGWWFITIMGDLSSD